MKNKPTTKERLIQAAVVIFAEKGYHNATVAEICEAAEANIAAVNYHFGDKENLYRQVWAFLFEKSALEHPLPTALPETEPERWLRDFIRSRIEEIFDTGICHRLPQLLHRIKCEHTELHDFVFETYLRPGHERVTRAIKALLGPHATDNQRKLAHINFMGLHIFLNVGHQKDKEKKNKRQHLPAIDDPSELARQVEEFALGGLLATRNLIQHTGTIS
ncbi:CerR family C-terminal domain-containing protein [Pontiellaceae bacterium B1224]|nr:CerR family C-terminal domain-containing protein [Pontiellaceae bacterium B1224]